MRTVTIHRTCLHCATDTTLTVPARHWDARTTGHNTRTLAASTPAPAAGSPPRSAPPATEPRSPRPRRLPSGRMLRLLRPLGNLHGPHRCPPSNQHR